MISLECYFDSSGYFINFPLPFFFRWNWKKNRVEMLFSLIMSLGRVWLLVRCCMFLPSYLLSFLPLLPFLLLHFLLDRFWETSISKIKTPFRAVNDAHIYCRLLSDKRSSSTRIWYGLQYLTVGAGELLKSTNFSSHLNLYGKRNKA